MRPIRKSLKPIAYVILTSLFLTGSGCMTAAYRGNPVPEALGNEVQVDGIPYARVWGDERLPYEEKWLAASEEKLATYFSGIMNREHNYLALSGGGAKGAFGAGLLAGWTATGARPEFTIVTGISTGSLIAPFAFLGPDYDDELKAVYSQYSTDDMVKEKKLRQIIRNDAVLNVDPMKKILAHYYNEDLVDAIARESRKGRSLLIGTTNLDAGRPVIWDIGVIAESHHPERVELIQSIILASCSIPGGFPPVLFEVEANGQTYDEMHVDGGCTNQVFLYPAEMDWPRLLDKLKVKTMPTTYVIRNARFESNWVSVKPRLASIAGRAISSLIRTQGIGDMYRIYLQTKRDGLDFNLAYIPAEFTKKSKETFDLEIMKELYALGYEMASKGYPWQKVPPGFEKLKD
ncbi:patatin-like phospholipase family protein [Planctomycetota bacterium]